MLFLTSLTNTCHFLLWVQNGKIFTMIIYEIEHLIFNKLFIIMKHTLSIFILSFALKLFTIY